MYKRQDLGYAKLDLHRKLRSGFPETVYCQGKPDQYLADIFDTLYRENGEVMGTRATEQQYLLVKERIPGIIYDPVSRILSKREQITRANCVITIAGMEGALGTVVAGLVENPVIAVPTSVGYGASFHGLSALLTMINSCANGISTVNIDNGYGAGYLAAQINRLAERVTVQTE